MCEHLKKSSHRLEDAFNGIAPFELDPRDLGTELSRFKYRVELLGALLPREERDDRPVIYFDPNQFPTEFSRERVMRQFAFEFPTTNFEVRDVSFSQLEHFSFTRYPSAEELFRRRGYLSNLEIAGFSRGRPPEKIHVARNRGAAWHHLTIVASHGEGYDPTAKEWDPPPEGDGKLASDNFTILENSLKNLIGENKRMPLVRRDGVYLPCDRLEVNNDLVALASCDPIESAMLDGRNDPFRLSSAVPPEIAEQVRFEYANSDCLFAGATREAVVLWQTQVLAYLRIAAWNVEFYGGKKLGDVIKNSRRFLASNKSINEIEKRITKDEIEENQNPYTVDTYTRLTLPEQAALNDIYDNILENLRQFMRVPQGTHCSSDLSVKEHFVAALHGSTYNQLSISKPVSKQEIIFRELDYALHYILPIASWLGDLKRRRRAVLDRGMAEILREVAEDHSELELRRFIPLITDRLSEEAWGVLIDACNELLDDDSATQPIEVVYDWIRDPVPPWGAERVDVDKIRIRGPLLDFPVGEAKRWNALAATLWSAEKQVFEHPALGARPPIAFA